MYRHQVRPTTWESEQISSVPSGLRPWEDRSLPAEERCTAYKGHIAKQIETLLASAEKLDEERLRLFEQSSRAQVLLAHGKALQSMTAKEYSNWFDGSQEISRLLSTNFCDNFLGAEQWRARGIDVGEPPPIPFSVTKELLESPCPFKPGVSIKTTHSLVLIPNTVNGEPYNALKLAELLKNSGCKLIYDQANYSNLWKASDWAKAPQAQSEWVLVPTIAPDPFKVPRDRLFLDLEAAGQNAVHAMHYGEYREARALELMTALSFWMLATGDHGWSRPAYPGRYFEFQCKEQTTGGGGRVRVQNAPKSDDNYRLLIEDFDRPKWVRTASRFSLALARTL